jgi:mono/diheme cytochrome c family protein
MTRHFMTVLGWPPLFRDKKGAICMKRLVFSSALLVLIASPVGLETRPAGQTAANQHQEMVTTYCVTCHSTRAKMGGLALEGLNLQTAAANAEIWEKALRKLRGNQMPPPGTPQPPQKDVESFVAWMENTLDTNAKGPKAAYLPIQRLNRSEYAASVKALVGVDVNPKEVLPQDIQVEGFDNIADALSVSPAFLDQYVTAARHIAQIAVGNPNPRVSSVKYSIDANQNPDNPPPLGTWGGMKFKHSFPADGEYQITLTNLAVGPYSNALEREHTVVILIDGRTVFRRSMGGPADLSLVDPTSGRPFTWTREGDEGTISSRTIGALEHGELAVRVSWPRGAEASVTELLADEAEGEREDRDSDGGRDVDDGEHGP